MQEILPGLSCLCTEDEFNRGAADNYQTVYVEGVDGKKWKHVRLENEGHFTFEVKKFPGEDNKTTTNSKTELKQDLKFLPDGKIPRILLDQIIAFFRKVMKDMGGTNVTSHGALEAMAHILWNPTKGYHVGIPVQKVGPASVNHDLSYITADDMIVIDIHSHNNMGAFYSGTDDRDDSRGVWISGVAGKLSKYPCDMVWRFNYESQKVTLKLEDIFEDDLDEAIPDYWAETVEKLKEDGVKVPEEWGKGIAEILTENRRSEVEVPQEWMDKVTKVSYIGGYGKVGKHRAPLRPGFQSGYSHGSGYQGANTGKKTGAQGLARNSLVALSENKNVKQMAKHPVRRSMTGGSQIFIDAANDEVVFDQSVNGYVKEKPDFTKKVVAAENTAWPIEPIQCVENFQHKSYYDALGRPCIPSGLGGKYILINVSEDDINDMDNQMDLIEDLGMLEELEADEWDMAFGMYGGVRESYNSDDMLPQGLPVISDDVIIEKGWVKEELVGLGFTGFDLINKGVSSSLLLNVGFEMADLIDDEDWHEVYGDDVTIDINQDLHDAEEQADAWVTSIKKEAKSPEEADEALQKVIQTAHDQMSERGQMKLAENGL